MNIALDMMGGDFAPLEAVKGVKEFLQDNKEQLQLLLVGDEALLQQHIKDEAVNEGSWKIVHAPQMIEMHEHPTKALKEKTQSSIAIGFHLLATGETDAFISAGQHRRHDGGRIVQH